MEKFITIDTGGRLEPGLVLSSGEPMVEGPLMLSAFVNKLWRNYPLSPGQQRIELIAEQVRREHFPQYPCRINCLFACQTWKQLEQTAKFTSRPENMCGPVYEISSENCAGPFDSDIIYLKTSGDLAIRAQMYWGGMRTNEPLLEWLVGFPIKIGQKIGTI
jgi:hypothetical protein